ncbi:MAG: hypothetical protein R6U25_02260 [Alkalispirochaeta sp.]
MKRRVLVTVIGILVASHAMAQLGELPAGYQIYRSAAAQLAFHYPQEWFVGDQEGSPVVVSREALTAQLSRDEPDLQPGDTVLMLGVLPTMFMAMMGVPVEDVGDIVDGMFENMIAQSGEVRNGEAETMSFGGRRVGSVVFDDAEDSLSGMITVVHEQEEVIGFGMAMGFREDLLRRRERISRIVSSMEFIGDFSEMLGQ